MQKRGASEGPGHQRPEYNEKKSLTVCVGGKEVSLSRGGLSGACQGKEKNIQIASYRMLRGVSSRRYALEKKRGGEALGPFRKRKRRKRGSFSFGRLKRMREKRGKEPLLPISSKKYSTPLNSSSGKKEVGIP